MNSPLSIYHVHVKIDDGRRGYYAACAANKTEAARITVERVKLIDGFDSGKVEHIERVGVPGDKNGRVTHRSMQAGDVVCHTMDERCSHCGWIGPVQDMSPECIAGHGAAKAEGA